MPTFTNPRSPASDELIQWVFPKKVNLIMEIAGLAGDGSVFRIGPDVSGGSRVSIAGGLGYVENYSADGGAAPGGAGTVHMDNTSSLHWGGGLVWGDFEPLIPAGSTISGVYGCLILSNATAGYPGISTIQCDAGRLAPFVAGPANYDGVGGANNDSGAINVQDPSGTTGPSGQFNSDSKAPPIDPATGLVDWSIYSICARLFQSANGQLPNQTLTITGVALAIYYAPGPPQMAIGHGGNLNDYDFGGFLDPVFQPGNGRLVRDYEPMRNWCRANGITASANYDSQRTLKDIADELLMQANTAPVYSGDELVLIPYDNVSAAGNGAIYISPTSSGPIADLDETDFYFDGKTPPVQVFQKRTASCDNVVSIEHINRDVDYKHDVTSEPDQLGVTRDGPRKGGTLDGTDLGQNIPSGTKAILSLHDSVQAQAIASIVVKRSANNGPEYHFTLKAERVGFEAMDLVTLTYKRLGLSKVPVQLQQVEEDPQNRTFRCIATLFDYWLNHPDVHPNTHSTGNLQNVNVDPGLVNAPIIFEPPAQMLPTGSGPQLWLLVSGADQNYGGCAAFVSVDGGLTYIPLSAISPATMGVLTADFPLAADPDTTDALQVDLTESNGSMTSQSTAIADGFADPCYVAGASGFEVICYTAVSMPSANHFSLGTRIRRGVQGTSIMDHPSGSIFGALDGQTLKVDIPSQWIGKTLHFKFAAFNKLGGQQNKLSDCADYTYTLTGGPSAEVYVDGVAVSFDDELYVDGVLVSGPSSVTVDGHGV